MSINLENVVLASPEQMEFIIEGLRRKNLRWRIFHMNISTSEHVRF